MNIQKFADYAMFVRPNRTDMRKRGSSLAMLVQQEMELNPFDKSLFVFCGKTRKILKVLVWDRNGFWECTKLSCIRQHLLSRIRDNRWKTPCTGILMYDLPMTVI